MKVAGLSTSLMVSVPLVLIAAAALVSVRVRVSDDSMAASLTGLIAIEAIPGVASCRPPLSIAAY